MVESLPINESVQVLNAEKHDFDKEYKAECCGSRIGKGNAMYSILSGGESCEVEMECCSYCLKKYAYFKQHQYDNFNENELKN